jgi:hypothetical protein
MNQKALVAIFIIINGIARGYSLRAMRWMYKQSVLETGGMTSRAYRQNKNAFGMAKVHRRPTTQVGSRPEEANDGENNTIGIYESVWHSVVDRFMWDKYFGISGKSSEYAQLVCAKGYNSRPTYLPAVNAMNDKTFTAVMAVIATIAPTTVVAIYLLLTNKEKK